MKLLIDGATVNATYAYDAPCGRFVYIYNCRICTALSGERHEVYSAMPCVSENRYLREGPYTCHREDLERAVWTFVGPMTLTHFSSGRQWVAQTQRMHYVGPVRKR